MKANSIGFILVTILISSITVIYSSGEFNASTVVSSVTEGDTFETASEGTVRLAEVSTLKCYECGYQSAMDFLISLIYGKTVYLEIDDIYGTSTCWRLICVVYVIYNSTHYSNFKSSTSRGLC